MQYRAHETAIIIIFERFIKYYNLFGVQKCSSFKYVYFIFTRRFMIVD